MGGPYLTMRLAPSRRTSWRADGARWDMVHGHLRIRPFSVPPSPRTPVRPDSRHRSCTLCSIAPRCSAEAPLECAGTRGVGR
ncbi:hypothetical protein COLSTE_02524 [Collinsella stercoris DSM 13279]|uniref:Uncharacterized protein n=1 Tax=Collinsella stercoris DSM 13279 TaxID=445975 RepID=B6GEI0_9ACTN|nr:hypothetical protein COLSTE_02524 [Collinsella stercoris DSM 13279]